MKKIWLGLLLLCLLLSGCGQTEKNTGAAPAVKNPAAAGTYLTVVSSLGLERTRVLAQAFADQTGIIVQLEELPAEPLSLRLQFLSNQPADIWLGGTAEEYYQADKQRYLQSYQAAGTATLPAELKDRSNRWTPVAVDYLALLTNRDKSRRLHIPVLNNLAELTQPVLYKDIVMARPENGGAGFSFITTVWQWWGKEQALEYAGRIRTQEVAYVLSDAEAALAVYQGQKTVAVLPLSYARALHREHRELAALPLQDCNGAKIMGAALLKSAPHPAAAGQFVDFLLSPAGQKLVTDGGLIAPGASLLAGGEAIPLVHKDLAWTGTYKTEIINTWLNAR